MARSTPPSRDLDAEGFSLDADLRMLSEQRVLSALTDCSVPPRVRALALRLGNAVDRRRAALGASKG